MERLLRYSAAALIVAMIATLSYGIGAVRTAVPIPASAALVYTARAASGSQFAIIDEVFDVFKDHFIDPDAFDYDSMRVGAIQGMIDSLGDPNQVYISAERYRLDRNDFEGSFEGIGATVSLQEGGITIVSPLRDSPAARAGILPLDIIVGIDGEDARGMSLADAVDRIRGPSGTTVRLTIERPGEFELLEFDIVRDRIKTESVFVRDIPDEEGLAHIVIAQFTQRTPEELDEILTELNENGVKGIVLDLRNNPGGLLQQTVDVTSQFLKDGIVLREIGRDGIERDFPVAPNGLATEIPLVVLVNEGSASGSEVLAGAIQDYDRAPIVGTDTFGKGSVNQVQELSDGSALYVTIARWFTPFNRQIDRSGLKPDIEVEFGQSDIENDTDPQFERALEILKSRI